MSLCFRQATSADIPQLISLWQRCFPEDDVTYISRFVSVIPVEHALVACKGDVLAMCYLLPAEVTFSENRYPVRYLYAGCTHPAHRREGIFARLLDYAASFIAAAGGYAIYLHPANQQLACYYERLGYRAGIGGWTCSSSAIAVPENRASAVQYMMARQSFLPKDRPVWRLLPPSDAFFLESMISDGWIACIGENGCSVQSPDARFAYDCLGTAVSAQCFGADSTGEWQQTAWWQPTGQATELAVAMNSCCGAYTAFLGDF